MENKVLRWCRENALFSPGDTVYAAVSGGADSVAMLHVLRALSASLGITLRAAHFDHALRGEESRRDAQFVQALCRSLDIPLTCGEADAAAYAERNGKSIEEAARCLRYAFFDSLPGLVATAHTADDNAETVLLNLLRGTGLRGLCGIPVRRGRIVRPMLAVTRPEIEAYLKKNGLSHMEDSTNCEDFCRRNRLRHHVLPLLREENPAFSADVLRTSALLREDEDYLQSLADAALEKARRGGQIYDCEKLCSLPQPVRRRCLRSLLSAVQAPKLSASHIEAVDALLTAPVPSARVSLPGGWEARREYALLRLVKAPDAPPPACREIAPEGVTELPDYGLRLQCTPIESAPQSRSSPSSFYLRCERSPSFFVRPRQEGDRLRLPGGEKSLKKLMIDRKIPAAKRQTLPVLADEQGVIGVYPLGWNLDRAAMPGERALWITIEKEE